MEMIIINMRVFNEYDGFYIDIDVNEYEFCIIPFIKWKEARVRTNINDKCNSNKDNKRRIMAYKYFNNYIRSIVPEKLVSTVIDEFDHIYYYYEYNNFITYGYVF